MTENFSHIEKERDISSNIIKPFLDKKICKMGRVVDATKDSVTIVYLERELYASDQTLNEIYSNLYIILFILDCLCQVKFKRIV